MPEPWVVFIWPKKLIKTYQRQEGGQTQKEILCIQLKHIYRLSETQPKAGFHFEIILGKLIRLIHFYIQQLVLLLKIIQVLFCH